MMNELRHIEKAAIRDDTDRQEANLHDLHDLLSEVTDDREVIREIEDQLDYGGSLEAYREIQDAFDAAERTAHDEFDVREGNVRDVQEEVTESEREVTEASDAAERTHDAVDTQAEKVKVADIAEKIRDAGGSIQRDVEELQHLADDLRAVQQSSEETVERLRRLMEG
ncbi:MAG: hypothetical protein AMXMBFR84_48190 [Candidatus Hydrogenedentota bacterium]